MTMEQAPPLKVIFCDNDIENGRHPEVFQGLFASGDPAIAFAVAEVANAVNRLGQSKRIEYSIPDEVLAHLKRTIQTSAGHKRKYDELLDRTEREARRV